jgi:hypothetical protein
MSQDVAMREAEGVVRRVLRIVPKSRVVRKRDFEAILNEIVMCVHRNRKTAIDDINAKTEKVLTDMPNEYGTLPENYQSWEALIGYLYAKYLKLLGQL